MFGNNQASMVNIPSSAQPFVRYNDSSYSGIGGIKEVSGIKAFFKVTDPYITDKISFTVAYVGSNNQKQLMEAYEIGVQVMQLCQKITQNGSAASAQKNREQEIMERVIKECSWVCPFCKLPNIGTITCNHCGEPVADEEVIALAKHIVKCELYLDELDKQADSIQMQQSVPQSWICSYCGAQNSDKFCQNCGAPRA